MSTNSNRNFSVRYQELFKNQQSLTDINNKIIEKNAELRELTTKSSEEIIYDKYAKVSAKRAELETSMEDLYKQRLKLYENLLSVYTARIAYENMDNKITDSVKYESIISTFGSSSDNEMQEKINDFIRYVNINDKNDAKLNANELESYGAYFLEKFDELKESFGLPNSQVNKDGLTSADILTYTLNNNDGYIDGSMLLEPDESGEIISLKLTLKAATDITLADGSQNYPFIINGPDDFNRYLEAGSSTYWILNTDVYANKNISFKANLDGNHHILTAPDNIEFSYGTVKNLKIRMNGTLPSKVSILKDKDTNELVKQSIETTVCFYPEVSSVVHISEYCTLSYSSSNKCYTIDAIGDDKNSVGWNKEYTCTVSHSPNETTTFDSVKTGEIVLSDIELTKDDSDKNLWKDEADEVYVRFNDIIDLADTVTISKLMYGRPSAENSDSTATVAETEGSNTTSETPKADISKCSGSLQFRKSDNSLKLSKGVGNPELLAGSLGLAHALAAVAAYKYATEESADSNDCSPSSVRNALNNLKSMISSFNETSEDTRSNLLNESTDVINKRTYIETYRQSSDSNYNSDLCSNLETLFQGVISSVSLMGADTGLDSFKEDLEEYRTLLDLETRTLIIGITSSISKLNYEIDNFSMVHSLEDNYKDSFTKMIDAFLRAFSQKPLSSGRGYRSFADQWMSGIRPFTRDSISELAQLYINQEIGINLLGVGMKDRDDYKVSIRSLVNDLIIRMYKKHLIQNKNGVPIVIKEIDNEYDLLHSYGIFVSPDAAYEAVDYNITKLIPMLKELDDINVEDILLDSTSYLITEKNIDYLIESAILIYLLEEKRSNGVLSRIRYLKTLLNDSIKNFKTLLVEYHFMKVLERLSRHDLSEETTILDGIQSDIKSLTDLEDIESRLKKYISVWQFRYYSEFSETGSILRFLGTISDDITKFLYNFSDAQYQRTTADDRSIAEKVLTSVKMLWSSITNWLF